MSERKGFTAFATDSVVEVMFSAIESLISVSSSLIMVSLDLCGRFSSKQFFKSVIWD